MGQVFVRLTLFNAIDAGMVRRGALDQGAVRSVEVESALVDTGATHLCLPADMIRTLGLEFARRVMVTTATGRQQASVYKDAGLSIEDRSVTIECLELPEGSQPLLGANPMQILGAEPDLANHRLRLLPEDGAETWVMI